MTLAGSSAASSPAMASWIRNETLSPMLGLVDVLSAAPDMLSEAGPGALLDRQLTTGRSGRLKVAAAQNSTRILTGA